MMKEKNHINCSRRMKPWALCCIFCVLGCLTTQMSGLLPTEQQCRRRSHFETEKNNFYVETSDKDSLMAASLLECSQKCLSRSDCVGLNFQTLANRSSFHICEILILSQGGAENQPIFLLGWIYLRKSSDEVWEMLLIFSVVFRAMYANWVAQRKALWFEK